ncbi:MAG: xylulokinase [Acidimicrobiales bacterium]
MMGDELCLSIDLGTGGPKVGLVTLDGHLVAHEVHRVRTTFGDDGAATQDPDEWWELICDAASRLLADPRVDRALVRAVAVTGQYASTVPVDAQGIPTGPCLTWLDTRGGPYTKRAIGGPVQGYRARAIAHFIRKTGGAPSLAGADPIGHMLFLTHERPDLCARTRWFMEPVDYLTMRFSGVASATHASRLAMWLTDNRRLDELDYDPVLLGLVGLSAEKLPPLVRTGSTLGPVTRDVGERLGLGNDVSVLAALPDLHAAAYGAGATTLHATHLALSTTSWISCPVPKKKTDIFHSIASVPGLTHGSYQIINNQETGAKALEWFQGILAAQGQPLTLDEMTSLAATSPPGARGVIFTPWLAGERSPVDDKSARAGFTNLSMTSSTADLIRAVMEGVAANSAWLFRHVEKFAATPLAPIKLVGGGAQSPLWCQIFADTLTREVHQVHEPMVAQLRGMALVASVSLGRRSFDDLATTPVPVRVFLPERANAEVYRQKVTELETLYSLDKTWRRKRSRTR